MQARISQQHRDIISVLPPEIIVQILSYTDALSIGCFSTASSTCKALIDQHSQIIYEAIANREFNVAVPCTAGDSGIAAEELPAFALQALEQITANGTIAPTERQLHEAIRYQRTSSTAYDNVRTWKEFVRKRTLIDYAWKNERPSRHVVARCPAFGELVFGFWRFKICSFSRRVIASTAVIPHMGMGVLISSPRAPEPGSQALVKHTRGWTHVEYSNGYLVCRSGAFSMDNPSSGFEQERFPPSPLPSTDIDQATIEVNALDAETGEVDHRYSITPPTPLMSYKARYPYLHALSRTESKAYLFDIEAGRLLREYVLPEPPEPAYVELDQWSLFLAGANFSVLDRKSGYIHVLLDDQVDDDHDQTWSTRWTAVHHSLDGRHILVAGDANELVWIRNYREILTSTGNGVDLQKLAENTVILRLEEGPGEVMVENICVENDRVVFTTQSTFYPVVYLFELCDWTDFNDFRMRPPRLRVLSGGLPTGHDGISRVEMDSTCIYLTASTRQIFKGTPGFEDVHPSDLELAWYRLDGTRICGANVRPTWPPSSPAKKHDMREFVTRPRVFLNDAILCYDFSRILRQTSSSPAQEQSLDMSPHVVTTEDLDDTLEDVESHSDSDEHNGDIEGEPVQEASDIEDEHMFNSE